MSAQFCQRCGSTLPDQQEGICPGCGTPFGARTVAISVGAGELLAAHEAKKNVLSPDVSLPLEASSLSAAGPGGGVVWLIAAVAGTIVVLLLVLLILLLRSA